MATARKARPLALVLLIATLAALLWLFTRERAAEVPDAEAARAIEPSRAAAQAVEPRAPDELERRSVPLASAAEVEATLPAAAASVETRVFGSVLDRSGRTIQGTWWGGVHFVDAAGIPQHADTKNTGTYEFRGLGFGSYWVTVQADGYRTLREQLELRPESPVVQKDFVLADGNEVRVKVELDDGGSLWDAMDRARAPPGARFIVPVATLTPPGKTFVGVRGSLNNKFGVGSFDNYGPRTKKLGHDYFGILQLDKEKPLYVSLVQFQSVLRTERVEPGQDEVTFVVTIEELLSNLARVKLRVVDAETSQPIRGVRAVLENGAGGVPMFRTDAEGNLELEGLAPGKYDLALSAPGFERLVQGCEAPLGASVDLGTVALGRELVLAGRALDAEGQPHPASFSIGVHDPDAKRIDWRSEERAKCNPDGSFEIRGLGRRQYALRTRNYDNPGDPDEPETWVSRIVTIDLRDGPVQGLEIRLERGSRLLLAHATAVDENLKFRVLDSRGLTIAASSFWEIRPRRLMLPRDDYRIVLVDSTGGLVAERAVELRGETLRLDLDR